MLKIEILSALVQLTCVVHNVVLYSLCILITFNAKHKFYLYCKLISSGYNPILKLDKIK